MDDLTEKQRRFVEAYVGPAEGNATKAARLAGYGGGDAGLSVRGAELVRNRKVIAAIDAAQAATRSAAVAERRERLEWLTAVMRGTLTAPEVDGLGNVVEVPPPWKERVKANELLGKLAGDFIEKREVSGAIAQTVVYLPKNPRIPSE